MLPFKIRDQHRPAIDTFTNGGLCLFKRLTPHDILTVIMGVITIEVPQQVSRKYQIASETKAKELIEKLDKMKPKKKKLRDLSDVVGIWADRPVSAEESVRDPQQKKSRNNGKKRDEFKQAMDAAFGMWSYRNESTEEIARKLRNGWNRKNGK